MKCKIKTGSGVAAKDSSKWFQEWANQHGIILFPGTLNAVPSMKGFPFPDDYICLKKFDYAMSNKHSRNIPGYSPRFYPAILNNQQRVWVFQWREFHGKKLLLEIVAEVCLREKFGLKDEDTIDLEWRQ
jgi:CTP-dependent riboflavin kinase